MNTRQLVWVDASRLMNSTVLKSLTNSCLELSRVSGKKTKGKHMTKFIKGLSI